MARGLQDLQVVQLVPSLLAGVLLNVLLALPLRTLHGIRCYYAGVAAPTGGKRVKARRGKKDDDIDLGGAETLVLAPLSVQQARQLTYLGSLDNLVRWRAPHLSCCSAWWRRASDRCRPRAGHAVRRVTVCALQRYHWPNGRAAAGVDAQRMAVCAGWQRCSRCSGNAGTGALLLARCHHWRRVPACVSDASALPRAPAQVDLLSSTTSPSNKVLAVFWGLGGFAVALSVHVLQPG